MLRPICARRAGVDRQDIAIHRALYQHARAIDKSGMRALYAQVITLTSDLKCPNFTNFSGA